MPRRESCPDSRTRVPSASSVPNASASPIPQSIGFSPAPIAARPSTTTVFSFGCTWKSDGIVEIARVTSWISAGVAAVGTSGTWLSGPPLMRDHAPAKVLGRGGDFAFVAMSSCASSSCRLPAAIWSVSSTVIFASPPGVGFAASYPRYAMRMDGLPAMVRYMTGCVYDGSSPSLCPSLR